jgi:hypothetical protein
MIREDAGRGALPRDRRRTSEHGVQSLVSECTLPASSRMMRERVP